MAVCHRERGPKFGHGCMEFRSLCGGKVTVCHRERGPQLGQCCMEFRSPCGGKVTVRHRREKSRPVLSGRSLTMLTISFGVRTGRLD